MYLSVSGKRTKIPIFFKTAHSVLTEKKCLLDALREILERSKGANRAMKNQVGTSPPQCSLIQIFEAVIKKNCVPT